MRIASSALEPRSRTTVRFRGLEFQVGDSARTLPALPIWMRGGAAAWELVGHALARPSQVAGLGDISWSQLVALRLEEEGDVLRLTGLAEPSGRRFVLTADDPLGSRSGARWLDAADSSSKRHRGPARRRLGPATTSFIGWYDFAERPPGDDWIGTEWPGRAWRRDEPSGPLQPTGCDGRDGSRFLGVEVQHHEFAIATCVRVPAAGSASGGLELHVDGAPRRIIVVRRPDGSIGVLDDAAPVCVLPSTVAEVGLALQHGSTAIAFEVVVAGRRVLRRTVRRASGPATAAGLVAGGPCAPIGFRSFEYRSGGSATANRGVAA